MLKNQVREEDFATELVRGDPISKVDIGRILGELELRKWGQNNDIKPKILYKTKAEKGSVVYTENFGLLIY